MMLSMYAVDCMDDMMTGVHPGMFRRGRCGSAGQRCGFGQKANVQDIRTEFVERKDAYELYADVPGLSKDDLQVEVEEQVIRISQVPDVREQEQHEAPPADAPSTSAAPPQAPEAAPQAEEQRAPAQEGRRRRFRPRVLTLPEDADISNASAKCDAGVLTLTIPKKAPAPAPEPRHIAVE